MCKFNQDRFETNTAAKPISPQKHNIYCKLDLNVGIEDICKLFGLKINSISSQRLSCRFSIKSASPERTRVYVCITAPNHVCNELVKINDIEFTFKCLFIEDPKLRPKVTNPSTITFTSPRPFEPLRFTNNSSDFGNNINNSKERDFHVQFDRAVRNSVQNSTYIFK